MKSADPVTYDDAGNVIPLSQRFNAENDDIRYSITGTGSEISLDDYMAGLDDTLPGTAKEKKTPEERRGRFSPLRKTGRRCILYLVSLIRISVNVLMYPDIFREGLPC